MENKETYQFTLIEVVVAIAIFAVGLTSALALTGSAVRRLENATQRWERQHVMAQAAEYFLVVGFEGQPTQNVFPTDKYSVGVLVEDVTDLPEGVEAKSGNWKLAKIRITLKNKSGVELDNLEFDKIIMEEDK